MTPSNTNRLFIAIIILFPVALLAYWVNVGFKENHLEKQRGQDSTNVQSGQAITNDPAPSPVQK
jgi:hypothetical protein